MQGEHHARNGRFYQPLRIETYTASGRGDVLPAATEGTPSVHEGNRPEGGGLPADARSHILDAIGATTTTGYRSRNLRPEEGEGDREAHAKVAGGTNRPQGQHRQAHNHARSDQGSGQRGASRNGEGVESSTQEKTSAPKPLKKAKAFCLFSLTGSHSSLAKLGMSFANDCHHLGPCFRAKWVQKIAQAIVGPVIDPRADFFCR